jgi:hypothetical protein
MYVIHNEIAILSLTGGLLDLPPELRKEAVKYKKPYSAQGRKTYSSRTNKRTWKSSKLYRCFCLFFPSKARSSKRVACMLRLEINL